MGSSRLLGDQSVDGQVATVSVSLVAFHCEPKLESGQSSSTNNYDCLAMSDPDNLNPFRVRWGLTKRQVLLSFASRNQQTVPAFSRRGSLSVRVQA
jgi:hypothetical protein